MDDVPAPAWSDMITNGKPIGSTQMTASELMKLPRAQRAAILESAAAAAEEDYRFDSALTAFDAFGEGDLHGGSASTEPR